MTPQTTHSHSLTRLSFLLVTAGLLLLAASVFSSTETSAHGSGAIWTTTGSCGDPQDVNHYEVGDPVFIHGENFDAHANEQVEWSITGQPGQASSDPGQVVASGNVTVGSDGSFCFQAYVVQPGDDGEYKAEVHGKQDNYHVDGNTPTSTSTSVPPTATNTATSIPPTATNTATPTSTSIPPTATNTATPTSTSVPPTATNTATPTSTSVPPTATNTATSTSTSIPPTATNTATPTSTSVPPTATNTATPTSTSVPPTATNTATPTSTSVPPTATSTATATATTSVTGDVDEVNEVAEVQVTATPTPDPATPALVEEVASVQDVASALPASGTGGPSERSPNTWYLAAGILFLLLGILTAAQSRRTT